jgi:hypothetical protein
MLEFWQFKNDYSFRENENALLIWFNASSLSAAGRFPKSFNLVSVILACEYLEMSN